MSALKQGMSLRKGKYKIVKMLGQGAFGITYLATMRVAVNGQLGRMEVDVNVTIKEFYMSELNSRAADGSSVEQTNSSLVKNYRTKFRREAENLSKLDHPNIVKVLEVFDENNTTYYVMEYIDGQTLDDYIKAKGRLEERETLAITRTVCSALGYMHGRRMLHLDLKPKNIMLNAEGKVYLIDFGLSKQYDENGEPESSTSLGLGTPGYAPIEQAHYEQDGTLPVTLDIYALGATIFKMLTGATPPHASDILGDGFPDERFAKLGISSGTTAIVRKAMNPIKRQRYQVVSELLANAKSANTAGVGNNNFHSYKKAVGEVEYGPEEVIDVERDDSLPMPDDVIKLSFKNPLPGFLSYDFYLDVGGSRHNAIIYRGNKEIADEFWWEPLSADVIDALRKNGFFSKVHWENETSTTPLTGGIDVSCSFFYKNGEKFVREVKHATPAYQHLLLDAVQDVVKVKELSLWIDKALDNEHAYSRDEIDRYGISILSIASDHGFSIYYRGHSFTGDDISVSGLKSSSDIGSAFDSIKYWLQTNNVGRTDLDSYLAQNHEIPQSAFNIITYCSESDLLTIISKLKQNPAVFGAHYRIVQEMQLIPLCFADFEDSLVSFEYQHLYCETAISLGVFEILKSGYCDEKQVYTQELLDWTLAEQQVSKYEIKKLSVFEGFAYLILGGIVQYHILKGDWEGDAVLLSTFPYDIKCEIWLQERYRDGFCLIDRNTSIPVHKSEIVIDENCTIIIVLFNERFSLDINSQFGYVPQTLEISVDIYTSDSVKFSLTDKLKGNIKAIPLSQLLDYKETNNSEDTLWQKSSQAAH